MSVVSKARLFTRLAPPRAASRRACATPTTLKHMSDPIVSYLLSLFPTERRARECSALFVSETFGLFPQQQYPGRAAPQVVPQVGGRPARPPYPTSTAA
ncbi:jg13885 [Pararge aegeria aegeria]|uniref:Jg13885 protein n=1 Tax=Pararge aegeria aegeria TaxID=348720 RepID=A0A8S4SFB1_9NEOP|nr:jg13885 [Pararge aegeria aegeria]